MFPNDTPGDIGANTITVRRYADTALLECVPCRDSGGCVEFPTVLEDGRVSKATVRDVAQHLFCVHNLMHLVNAARGEHDDHCRCQFCEHRRSCVQPGTLDCQDGPKVSLDTE